MYENYYSYDIVDDVVACSFVAEYRDILFGAGFTYKVFKNNLVAM